MSSLLTSTTTRGRLAPGRTWLVVLVAVALLTAVASLAAAGKARTPDLASLTTTAQHSAARQPAAAAVPAAAKGAQVHTAAAASASTKTVMIMNYAYSPASLTIKVGDTVTWTNMDSAPHTVTVTSGPVKFNSGNLAQGQSFTYTFTVAGTYSYYCAVHPDMTASVTVTGTSSPPPTTPTTTPTPTTPSTSACGGLNSAVNAFLQHFYAAHLETSLTQQATDALDVDKYAQVHLVLVENMLKPLLGGLQSATDVFLQHVYAAHLETSVTDQVADALDLSQYIKTHTVMIENMVKPLAGTDVSSC